MARYKCCLLTYLLTYFLTGRVRARRRVRNRTCLDLRRVIHIHEPTNRSAPAVCNGRVAVACRQEPARCTQSQHGINVFRVISLHS